MRSLVLVFVALGLSACTASSSLSVAGTQGWHTHQFDGARFTVKMPISPSARDEVRKTVVGSITTQVVTAIDEDEFYMVTRTILPRAARAFSTAKQVYGNAKGGLLSESFSKQVSYEKTERHGVAGMRLVYETPPVGGAVSRKGLAELYYYDGVLVIFDAAVEGREVDGAFFDSIRRLN